MQAFYEYSISISRENIFEYLTKKKFIMKICSCLNKGVMIAVAVVCSAGLQSCLDDNDKYYYVEGFPNALVTVKMRLMVHSSYS